MENTKKNGEQNTPAKNDTQLNYTKEGFQELIDHLTRFPEDLRTTMASTFVGYFMW